MSNSVVLVSFLAAAASSVKLELDYGPGRDRRVSYQ